MSHSWLFLITWCVPQQGSKLSLTWANHKDRRGGRGPELGHHGKEPRRLRSSRSCSSSFGHRRACQASTSSAFSSTPITRPYPVKNYIYFYRAQAPAGTARAYGWHGPAHWSWTSKSTSSLSHARSPSLTNFDMGPASSSPEATLMEEGEPGPARKRITSEPASWSTAFQADTSTRHGDPLDTASSTLAFELELDYSTSHVRRDFPRSRDRADHRRIFDTPVKKGLPSEAPGSPARR